ncbi:MAG: radical SAM protein [Nitrospirota bacterium]|nr:radical SAM protein [Nitrospirota bacterium]
MSYFLSRQAALKMLENPSVYQIARDELYELDQESFRFLGACAIGDGCEHADSAFIDYCLEEGLLTRDRADIARPLLTPSPEPSLRYLELQITDRCNLRCGHCYLGDGGNRDMPVALVRKVLREFEEMQGLRVLLTGGEPLLHSRFDEINEMLADFFLRRVLFTNGVLMTPERLKRLKVHELQVSIDGMRSAHDRLRGPGNWDRSMETLRQAQDAGFDISVSTMVTSLNLGDFDAMESLFRSLGVREWTVDAPCPSGRLRENADLLVSPETGGTFLGYGYGGGMHAPAAGYGCGVHLMAVFPDGKAAKCTFYGDRPVGTVEDGLRTCWELVRPVKLEDLECSCEYRDVCRGGCRFRAEQDGNPAARDPYRCSLYGVIDRTDEP